MRCERFILNEERNVGLTAYIQETGGTYRKLRERPGILVIPGGGYHHVSRREGDPVAARFLEEGYQVMILEYSVGEHAAWPHPLEDYEQAMELIGERAAEWHLNMSRFAVIGFSAGGACHAGVLPLLPLRQPHGPERLGEEHPRVHERAGGRGRHLRNAYLQPRPPWLLHRRRSGAG